MTGRGVLAFAAAAGMILCVMVLDPKPHGSGQTEGARLGVSEDEVSNSRKGEITSDPEDTAIVVSPLNSNDVALATILERTQACSDDFSTFQEDALADEAAVEIFRLYERVCRTAVRESTTEAISFADISGIVFDGDADTAAIFLICYLGSMRTNECINLRDSRTSLAAGIKAREAISVISGSSETNMHWLAALFYEQGIVVDADPEKALDLLCSWREGRGAARGIDEEAAPEMGCDL